MKIFLDMVGCRLNQSEIEKMAAEFRGAGNEITSDPAEADLIIINTCAVTASAAADSRKKIRRAARSSSAEIIATGCYATVDPAVVSELPGVAQITPNINKEKIVENILGEEKISSKSHSSRKPLPGKRKRTRAFIKVQDGCDNACTYCITRLARGPGRSVPEMEIFNDIEYALDGGVKEIVLTGVNLGSWGKDIKGSSSLYALVGKIQSKFDVPRIRLSSLEPWDVDERIVEILELKGFCHHLHLPLQSGSDKVLRLMNRKINRNEFIQKVDMLRNISPDMAITTDIMVGFPGETDVDFLQTVDILKKICFSGGHVFRYSPRPGTSAEKMGDRVPIKTALIRGLEIRKIIEKTQKDYMGKFKNAILEILWERSVNKNEKWDLQGLSENYMNVRAESDRDLRNRITNAQINGICECGLTAEIF